MKDDEIRDLVLEENAQDHTAESDSTQYVMTDITSYTDDNH